MRLLRAAVTTDAQTQLLKLRPDLEELDKIAEHLDRIAADPIPGEPVPFNTGDVLFYSDIGRFRCLYKVRRFNSYPKLRTTVVGFLVTS